MCGVCPCRCSRPVRTIPPRTRLSPLWIKQGRITVIIKYTLKKVLCVVVYQYVFEVRVILTCERLFERIILCNIPIGAYVNIIIFNNQWIGQIVYVRNILKHIGSYRITFSVHEAGKLTYLRESNTKSHYCIVKANNKAMKACYIVIIIFLEDKIIFKEQ